MRTEVDDDGLVFRLADPAHEHARVSVWCDVDLGVPTELTRVDGGWELRASLPDLDCVEYLFDVDGGLRPDPGNPDLVDGAFGPHSWLPLPGYRPPAWLEADPVPGVRRPGSAGGVDVEVWEPDDGPLPLLVAHDGPEMDRFGDLVRYVAAGPRVRVALLSPGPRDDAYSANPAYSARLVGEVVPWLTSRYPTVGKPALLGQSLGGLAALHAAWSAPQSFAAVGLQSGSLFTPELDPQEAGFTYFGRITAFVAEVSGAASAPAGLPPLVMTCGTAEENLANNVRMRDHLRSIGVDVAWGETRQGHTWTCWRDTLDPHLTDLLRRVWDLP